MSSAESLPEVAVLRWPADAAERWRLASLGVPRLLVVEEGVAPPEMLGDLEDWVLGARSDPSVTVARSESLRRRAWRREAPTLDADGLLRFGGRWIDISDAQLPVVDLLVRRFGSLVRMEELTAAYESGGGSGHARSMSTVVARVRHRVEVVGLALHAVRRRGVVLHAPRS